MKYKNGLIEFAVDNGYLNAVTVCSGVNEELDDLVIKLQEIEPLYRDTLIKADDRSLFKKVIDYVFT